MAVLRGHDVVLSERSERLGGQFQLAAGQPERGEINQFLAWQEGQVRKLGVDVRLRTDVTADTLPAFAADEIVLATGGIPNMTGFQRAFPGRAKLPGVDLGNVCTIHDVLEGRIQPGARVLLLDDLDGWPPSSLTALHLAQLRHQVVLVTTSKFAAAQLEFSGVGGSTRQRFLDYRVETLAQTAVLEWKGDRAVLLDFVMEEETERKFDTLVLALPNLPNDTLYDTLLERGIKCHLISDAMAARTAALAIYEGRVGAMNI